MRMLCGEERFEYQCMLHAESRHDVELTVIKVASNMM
jgi:hypothetical protein